MLIPAYIPFFFFDYESVFVSLRSCYGMSWPSLCSEVSNFYSFTALFGVIFYLLCCSKFFLVESIVNQSTFVNWIESESLTFVVTLWPDKRVHRWYLRTNKKSQWKEKMIWEKASKEHEEKQKSCLNLKTFVSFGKIQVVSIVHTMPTAFFNFNLHVLLIQLILSLVWF